MALLDIDKSYIKIDYTHSGVMGGLIQVSFATYVSQAERDKEKEREESVSLFLQKLGAKISALEEEANQRWSHLLEDEITTLRNTPDFINWEQLIYSYGNTYSTFAEYAYKVVDEPVQYQLFLSEEELNQLGFKIEWFTDPVRHNGFTTVNCGLYDNINRPELTMEFFYNKLKEQMNPEVLDA